MVATKGETSVRDRLLEAANELFYGEGVHTVGIDRVIERAGVAKASLYGTFGSKDELVRAYLERRSLTRRERITERLAQYDDPRARVLAIFELTAEIAAEPSYRGCAFVNAVAEEPQAESKIRQVCNDQRAWVRALFTSLARELGVADAARVGRQLGVLYDGAMIGTSMDRDPSIANEARAMAVDLLDAAVLAKPQKRARGGDKTPRSRARRRLRPS
ncbi:MAG TPA: TetR/AcrR family transcriptional regulator [Polyangiaceae bacterium]|jgi:AcrR family transcriptional regulator